ncbi:MAG: DNA polymerase I [Anaerolineae bacterium]
MDDRKGKLILIDGHALAYRAYHALPPTLSTSKGELTNAVYGFTSTLLKVLREEEPDYIVVAFDVGRTFRHDQFPEYKAHRAKMPDELHAQMERIRELIRAFNIPIFEVEGYEADDVLGTLARQAGEKGVETLIVTGDTDTFQLVDSHTRVLTSRRRFSDTVVYDEEAVRERYGLEPGQLVDLKGFTGDSSDNIPGVSGIGQKTATQLLKEFNTIEEVYAHQDEIPNKRARKALEGKEEIALLSKRLATIVTDVPIELDLKACRAADFDREAVIELFRTLEFRSLLAKLPESDGPARAQQMPLFAEPGEEAEAEGYQVVNTPAELDRLVEKLSQTPALAFDVETTHTDAMQAELVGIALAAKEGEGFYIPVGHQPGLEMTESNLDLGLVRERLGPVLSQADLAKYGHNAKYDIMVLERHGFSVEGLAFDTMIAAYLLEPTSRSLGLKDLAWTKLGVEMTTISDLIGRGRDQITMAQVPISRVGQYAGADVDMTYRLARQLEGELREKRLWDLFVQVEMPLVSVLAHMELNGVALDTDYLIRMSRDLHQRITTLEKEIYEEVGHQFNVSSTQQLGTVLFEELGLPVIRRTKTGYSTAVDVLEQLQGTHPVVDLVLEYRHLTKLKSTYVDALPLLVNRQTGRVHTSYNQTGTVTGRLSSSDPNLQNIPIRTEPGRQIRRAFVAPAGHLLLAADYSQVELRILAHISQDEGLLSAFQRDEDIHASTAATVFGVPLQEVTPAMRRIAKTINFGIIYGVSDFGLAQRTELTQEEAKQFIDSYFVRYGRVKEYISSTKREAAKQGYVETLLGRRRYFPELKSGSRAHGGVRRAAERAAINHPIQGSAADIIKIAMVQLHQTLQEKGLASKMMLQVHDELVLEVPEEELEVMVQLAPQIMSRAYELAVPLKVDVKMGRNWEEMEEVSG